MAGDWIKMRTDLRDDPAVIAMADALNLDPDLIVGKLHRLWSWATTQLRDGNAVGVTDLWIDRYISVTGFAQHMQEVGWLVVEKSGITFPNWESHLSKGAKNRANTKNRVAKMRNASSVTEALPEKRREEKRREEEKTPLPPKAKKAEAEEPELVVHEFGAPTDGRARIDTTGDSFDAVASVFEGRGFGGVKFQNALRGFYDHRRASGKPLTTSSAAAMAAKFESNGGVEPAIRALIDSTANGWQGVFPEKYQREAKAGKGSIGDVIAEMQRRREQDERRSA